MSNVDKLKRSLESIDNMTDSEYNYLYDAAKQLDDNCGIDIVIDWPGFIEHRRELKKSLMQRKEWSNL